MDKKTFDMVLKTLAEKIENLELDVKLKEWRISELENELKVLEEAKNETV